MEKLKYWQCRCGESQLQVEWLNIEEIEDQVESYLWENKAKLCTFPLFFYDEFKKFVDLWAQQHKRPRFSFPFEKNLKFEAVTASIQGIEQALNN